MAIAAPLGVKCNGGYSRLVKINENYLDKMNKNLSTKNNDFWNCWFYGNLYMFKN